MNDYKINLPNKTQNIRHPKIRALKGTQIGPAWSHPDPEHELGMRHVPQSAGQFIDWTKYREKRRKRNQIASQSRRRNGK